MLLTKHILNILATWRLTEMLHDEALPFDLGDKLRDYAFEQGIRPYIHASYTGKAVVDKPKYRIWHEVHSALQCKWCLSVWCGLFVTSVTGVSPLYALAYSAASLMFGKLFNAIPTSFIDRQVDEYAE